MCLNLRINFDDGSDFWGLFLCCDLFFALCKHILRCLLCVGEISVKECLKGAGVGIQIQGWEGSINVNQGFITDFKLKTDCIVLVMNKGI